jgi:plasmid stabilization system protein ParE
MGYLVNVTARAERDLALLFDKINAEYSDTALKWYRGLKEAILNLKEHPNRCHETPENAKLRHLLYGNTPHVYRVIYRVTERSKRVDVLHIRHGARQRFKRSEISNP